ncbi:MAG: alpha-2-macroglobulin family protein, partial [Dehalococcoidia bacterium]
ETAEVLIPAPFAGAQAFITIERGNVIRREVRRLETNSETLSIPIEDGFVPNVYVSVVLYREPTDDDPIPRYHLGYIELPISTATRTLDVQLTPSVEQAEPGETVRYDMVVTDSAGRPVQAELSVNMVDAAVLSLSDLVDQDGLQAFWYERALGVRTGSSVSVSVERSNDAVSEPESGGKGGGDGADALRSEFRNTAFWEAQVTTDADGRASVEVTLPDNLTTWRTQVRAVSGDTLVGEATDELLATKQLLVRPALPRFVRVGDAVTLRTLVRNGTDIAQEVSVSITADGLDLGTSTTQTLVVEPNQSGEFQWPATASEAGTASISFRAVAAEITDAVAISIPVYLDVTPETMATGGVVTDEGQVEALYLPPYAILANGSLEVGVQASIVGALQSELGPLAPTLFEPSVRVAARVIGTIAARRAEGLSGAALTSGLDDDLRTLQAIQLADGGWGWCTGPGCRSDAAVTAWVLSAFGDARVAG